MLTHLVIKISKATEFENPNFFIFFLLQKESANHVYLVMEYCNGGDLADYLHGRKYFAFESLIKSTENFYFEKQKVR